RPPAKLGKYKDLKVPREEPNNGDDRVEEELERMVAQAASLEPTEDPAAEGDSVVVDYVGAVDGVEFDGGKGSDQLIELGAGRLIPGFEEQLIGVVKDEKRTLNLTFPEDYPAENLAGKDATFDVTVQEVRAKSLPELDDQFAEQLGHDSVADLRQDIKDRLTESEERRIDSDFRAACVDAAAENAKVELTDELIEGRARELWERTLRSMEAQGINRETYLQISGKSEEEIIGEAKEEAATGLRREATLEAVVNAEGIDPTEEQMLEALEHSAGHEGVTSAELLERIRNDRREDALKSDLASRLAVDLMVESAKPVAAPRKAD
ncbi:MAG: trigger factor, partial [Actinomycetes bacterium]